MASKESMRVGRYWATVRQSTMNPQPDDLVTNGQWDLLTGEPGGVDYLEVDANGVPALWAVPHGTAQDGPALLEGSGQTARPVGTHPHVLQVRRLGTSRLGCDQFHELPACMAVHQVGGPADGADRRIPEC